MASVIFVSLLLIMLFILYRAGIAIRKSGKVFSSAGIAAISIYTLNEGLRFGRGIDYNLYYNTYLDLAAGRSINKEPVFSFISEFFISFGLPYQALILFMSFMFILSLLYFLRNYRDLLPLALPLFVFFSRPEVENMVRWYLAFSFFLFGLADLIKKEKLSIRYLAFSFFACSIHYAIIPIPIFSYVIYRFKHVFLKPFLSLSVFFAVYFFFETDFMLQFVDLVNMLADVGGERFANYGKSPEYWLSGGFAGEEKSGKIGISELAFLSVLVILGNRVSVHFKRPFIFSYNMFLVGFLLLPIAKKVEFVGRYDAIFYFFRAIVLAAILYTYYICKYIRLIPVLSAFVLIILLYNPINSIKNILTDNPKKYLYVWDKSGMTPGKMYEMWIDDLHKNAQTGTSKR